MTETTEKRVHERLDLGLPCLLSVNEDGVFSHVVKVRTRNISAGGILVGPVRGDVLRGVVRLDIILAPHITKTAGGLGTHFSVGGEIVHSTEDCIGIAFKEEGRVASLDVVLRFLKQRVSWMERQKELILANDPSNLLHLRSRFKPGDVQKTEDFKSLR